MGRTISRIIDLSEVPYDEDEYEYEIEVDELLGEIELDEIIEYHEKEIILGKLGYSEDLCFKSDIDLKEAVEFDPGQYDIELKERFDTMNDQDIYDRFVELLSKNKLTYSDWDEFLKKYE